MGLAFADTLLAGSDADIVIVDRHGLPGGHWNDAYPFVALHQPSEFYGVANVPCRGARAASTTAGSSPAFWSSPRAPRQARRRWVDGTYYGTSVPSTHRPPFHIAEGARRATPNELPQLWKQRERAPSHVVILGGGKTAMDVGVYLLQCGARPEQIRWGRPRDIALLQRITQVLRHGHVRAVEPSALVFDDARVELPASARFIDCTTCRAPRSST